MRSMLSLFPSSNISFPGEKVMAKTDGVPNLVKTKTDDVPNLVMTEYEVEYIINWITLFLAVDNTTSNLIQHLVKLNQTQDSGWRTFCNVKA